MPERQANCNVPRDTSRQGGNHSRSDESLLRFVAQPAPSMDMLARDELKLALSGNEATATAAPGSPSAMIRVTTYPGSLTMASSNIACALPS